ncbi:U32 family peptidase [Vibrio lentus]|nr:U32 family peptidase [Vibrio lentus]
MTCDLSRELSLEEIEEIREHCPKTELGNLVHGTLYVLENPALVVLPTFWLHEQTRSNQGTCTNACRWEYKTEAAKRRRNGRIVEANPTGVAIQEVETQGIEVQDERPDNTLGLGKAS